MSGSKRTAPWPNGLQRERPTDAPDCGVAAQAAHRPLASRYQGPGSAGCRVTSGVMTDSMEGEQRQDKRLGSLRTKGPADESEVAVPRRKNHGFERRCAGWARRPGASPPMRMTASWLRSSRIDRIQGCGATSAPRWRAPPRIMSCRSSGCEILMSVKGERTK